MEPHACFSSQSVRGFVVWHNKSTGWPWFPSLHSPVGQLPTFFPTWRDQPTKTTLTTYLLWEAFDNNQVKTKSISLLTLQNDFLKNCYFRKRTVLFNDFGNSSVLVNISEEERLKYKTHLLPSGCVKIKFKKWLSHFIAMCICLTLCVGSFESQI